MAVTPNIGLKLLSASQSQKHVTVNENARFLDALFSNPIIAVLDNDLTAPPGSPADGAIYIVKATATGAWATHEDDIAYYDTNTWVFFTPEEGWIAYIVDEDVYAVWTGTAWADSNNAFQNVDMLGVNTTATGTNKLAVKSNAVLFTALLAAESGDGNMQTILNKEAAGDTSSILFQTNFSTRVEVGCIGDDDLTMKVSPNGSTFYSAIIIDKDDGRSRFLGLGTTAAATLTIAAGVVTVTQTAHKIDTEAAAASDDLVTVNGGYEGALIILEAANDARTVVLKHNTGNIFNASGADVSLDNYGDTWMGRYDGSKWLQL